MTKTLKLLICLRTGDVIDDFPWLAFTGEPEGFYANNYAINDLEFGDEDCDAFPAESPKELGLWLLTWDYQMVTSEFSDGLTAKYADHCTWTRPTAADLQSMGMLP